MEPPQDRAKVELGEFCVWLVDTVDELLPGALDARERVRLQKLRATASRDWRKPAPSWLRRPELPRSALRGTA